ncbi:MAG: SpoIID/LytB domain-containing protein [Acidimicrobiia bacterium]|nr:SpoIID/LytB domain-containing protein [Acidimicrobiia bacterium]
MFVVVASLVLALAQSATPWPVESVTLDPGPGTTLAMGRGAYEGRLEIGGYRAGLAAVETATIEDYLLGITEVPSSWPSQTLAAQAVAARTYLAWTLHRGRSINGQRYDYDICASQYCQVYRGPGDAADRWARAVGTTAGQILLHDGRPAQALYSSSAGARTRSVQDVFGGSGVPYLQAVDSPELDVTPYRQWELTVSPRMFRRVFARGGYEFEGEVSDVVLRNPGEGNGLVTIDVVTAHGVTTIPVTDFRAVFNRHGPALYPNHMPVRRANGDRWPQTVLSYTFDIDYEAPSFTSRLPLPESDAGNPGRLTVTGQGWGHGVGMSQWGAMAMGSAGAGYEAILNQYYGLDPVEGGDTLPESVRIGLAVERREIAVVADGPFELVTDEFAPVSVEAGEWVFRRFGRKVIVLTPEGHTYDSQLLRVLARRPLE